MAETSARQEALRSALFVPCETKEALKDWIRCYLGNDLDLPDTIVSQDSTTSPMDFIWHIYDAFRCRRFNLPEQAKYNDLVDLMAYASRDSFKTLGASILEVVVLMHMSLSVAHMAAIDRQAKKAQQYVKDFISAPIIRDFVTVRNETRVEITRYTHRVTGKDLTEPEFLSLSPVEQDEYDRRWNYIAIVICTLAGANSEHVPFMVVDEVDTIPSHNIVAYGEAKMIPSPWQGVRPITLYISTRKTSFGLVQQELNDAHETGMQVLHWNIIDVTHACAPERHLPEGGKIPIYYVEPAGQTRGSAISEEAYKELPEEKQQLYTKTEGYKGCLSNCKLFFACKGNLANKQPGTSELLKTIDHTTGLFRKVAPHTANAQLLCKKPSEEGLIYPRMDRTTHVLTAAQIAEKITGDKYDPKFTRAQLVSLCKERGCEFTAGIDHGFSHNFAVVTGVKDGNRIFIIDVQAVAELELAHKVALLKRLYEEILQIDPRIWPDTSEPGSNTTIRKAKFRVQDWVKGKDSVTGGIEIVRGKLYPAFGDPQMYFLADDVGVEMLFSRMSRYHWTMDAAGRPTNVPDEYVSKDEMDDECDAARYMIMNEFKPRGSVLAGAETSTPKHQPSPEAPPTQQTYLTHFINQHLGLTDLEVDDQQSVSQDGASGRSGRFIWSMD